MNIQTDLIKLLSLNKKVILVVAETTFRRTDEFEYNRDASEQVGSWFDTQYSNITSNKFEGWWYIHNQFYDLQLGLFEGTKASLGKKLNFDSKFHWFSSTKNHSTLYHL